MSHFLQSAALAIVIDQVFLGGETVAVRVVAKGEENLVDFAGGVELDLLKIGGGDGEFVVNAGIGLEVGFPSGGDEAIARIADFEGKGDPLAFRRGNEDAGADAEGRGIEEIRRMVMGMPARGMVRSSNSRRKLPSLASAQTLTSRPSAKPRPLLLKAERRRT